MPDKPLNPTALSQKSDKSAARFWLTCATRFTFGTGVPPNQCRMIEDYPINIERCDQRDGVTQLWAVRRGGNCLGTDGEWEHESQPSSRDAEWMRTHRFPTKESAYAAALPIGGDTPKSEAPTGLPEVAR